MPSITEQSAWAEASHVILLISGSDYFRKKAEFMKKAHSHSDPGSCFQLSLHFVRIVLASPVLEDMFFLQCSAFMEFV